jgi:hypothetical protein
MRPYLDASKRIVHRRLRRLPRYVGFFFPVCAYQAVPIADKTQIQLRRLIPLSDACTKSCKDLCTCVCDLSFLLVQTSRIFDAWSVGACMCVCVCCRLQSPR